MSTTYSPSGTFPTWPLVLPQDGEIINEAVLVVGILEPLIDAAGTNAARTWTAEQTFDAAIFSQAPKFALGAITDTATFTIDVSKPIWIGPTLSQQCVVTVQSSSAPIPAEGQVLRVGRDPDGGGFSYVYKREGAASAIVTVGADATDPRGADLIYRGGVWRLLSWTPGSTPGADA